MTTDNFIIEDLGIQEQWVYDIEVQDNHNFFANDILVHNSGYFTVDNFVEKAFQNKPDATKIDKVEFCDKFYNQVVDKFVQKSIDDFGKEYNAYNTDVIGSEREIIADCLSPRTPLRISINETPKTLTISELARKYGINTTTKNNEIVDISKENIMIGSYGLPGLELKKVLNIQKKVSTKKMVKLTAPNGKSIIVTEDHKIAVNKNGSVNYIEAKNITSEDDVIYHNFETTTRENNEIFGNAPSSRRTNEQKVNMKGFTVEPYNYKEERKIVYDIEVQDNHNFYANGILVHNCGLWTAKKKYFARVIDSEGVRYKEPKLKVMGLDIIRSGTPTFVKKKLKESLDIILDSDVESMIKWKDNVKLEFMEQNLNNIAKVQGVLNIDYAPGAKGVPIGARSVLVHNKYIKKLKIENEIQLLNAGNKVKLAYLKEPNIFNSNVIAWSDDKFVNILKDTNCFDYELNFEKFFLSPLQLMTDALNWNITKETASLDDW